MSHAQENHNEENQSLIKTPKQLIVVVALAIIVPVIVIMLLAGYAATGTSAGAGSDALTTQSIDARIAPVAGFELVNANAPRELLTGDAVYKQVCAACHGAGVAGAPKFGDKAAWSTLAGKGIDALLASAINGKGAMPPKGGATQMSDFEIHRAVVYMANEGGASFPEPEAPAEGEGGAASADAGAPAAPAAPATAAAPKTLAPSQPAPAQVADAAAGANAPAGAAPAATAAAAPSAADTVGKKLYETACFACHGTGVAGAPKFGDKAAWAPIIASGMDAMMQIVINGKGAMPPRGTAMNASDDELRAAVEYMVKNAQ